MHTSLCLRWSRRRCTWRPAGAPFDKRLYEVAPIDGDAPAKAFVKRHHYSASYPSARRRFGLYGDSGALVGVAVFSHPCRDEVLKPFAADVAVELGRLVLLDEVPGNAESYFVARCLDLLRREGFEGVVSFSDPLPRAALNGRVVMPGHVGKVYQAVNAVYRGQARGESLLLLPNATVMHRRALAKIRAGDSRWRSAIGPLLAAGAAEPTDTSAAGLRVWLDAELPALVRRVAHPGNHKYLLPLTPAARKACGDTKPYPRLVKRVPSCEAFDGYCLV